MIGSIRLRAPAAELAHELRDVAASAPAPAGRPAEAEMRYTVAVDCDGVIHSYSSGWQGADMLPDPPVAGAIAWLNEIVASFDVVIHTTRGDQPGGNAAVLAYLRDHGYVGPDLVVTSHKVPALIYIDDRGWRFEGTFPSADQIHRALPWSKAKS